ncbi:hypothetical protein P8Q88_07530 [Qipengyuania sp. XHP0207]|uniref:hypothetical protein n=1 Tax=Qipengyuania sp. XHP0207 TaxID=3038078 RepID=UPI00241F165A|nr:hypothetical protein [Qipengyuania sp. XHP0207]MDG5748028.1 hypothetical protein [Qipengyuania sp. XHP0207]
MSVLPKFLLLAAGLLIEQGVRQRGKEVRVGSSLKATMADWKRQNRRRKPPEAGLPVPAIPPTGPLPKQGGAEASLSFD